MRDRMFLKAISSDLLELRLMVTEQCNFRCTYCYEDFLYGKMERKVVDGIKRLMRTRCEAGLKVLNLHWFGGEPLLAVDIIEELSCFAFEMQEAYGVKLGGGTISTNGFGLNKRVLSKLVNLGVKEYQITLDGSRNAHDLTRRKISGKGTFDRIVKNLVDAKSLDVDFDIVLRLHIHDGNYDDVKEGLLPFLMESFLNDKRFSVHPIAIGDFGGAFSESGLALAEKVRSDEVVKAVKMAWNQKEDERDNSATVCYAATLNSFLIRSNGEIGKCTTALNDVRNRIGFIKEDGSLELDMEKSKLWMHGFSDMNVDKLACPLYGLPKYDNFIPIFDAGL
ncbi:radical SAM protein [Chromobacterium vaccinii]|uniref:radical SAM protein n=1 Tax=Chromobacterium vaccinii TaxID=1108595 RepID=UPI0009E51D73|nr:radical SAM protein [Chromobacterium vaccinii]